AQFGVQLIEQLTVPVRAIGDGNCRNQHGKEQHQHRQAAVGHGAAQRAHRSFSATRMTALRERGLALSSSAEAYCGLPRSLRRVTDALGMIAYSRGIGSVSLLSPRRTHCLTLRYSGEGKLITTCGAPTSSPSSAASRLVSRAPSSLLMKMRNP